MARRIVGYDAGSPIYEDEGPARAGGGSLGGVAGTVMPDKLLVGAMFTAGGAGEVERRQITDDERAARASRDDAPSLLHRAPGIPSPARPHNTAAQSRARGAARAGFTPGTMKPYLAARLTQPVTSSPSPLEEGSMSAAPAPLRPDGRRDGELAVPCAPCIKADVCSIRPTLDLHGLVGTGREPHPAIHLRVVVECDYFLAAARPKKAREGVTPGAPVRRATPGPFAVPRPGGAQRSQEPGAIEKRDAVDKRAREIAAVVERHGGDRRAAAAELGMRPQAVGRILTSYLGRVEGRQAVPA